MSELMDASLVADFVTESREHLDGIEPDLLAMEQEGHQVSGETINRVFRAIHSIKGGAGFLAFEGLKRLSHAMESVLMLVRDGKLSVSPELMDVLLGGVDKLRAMVEDIQSSDGIPIDEDLHRLGAILEGGGVPAATAPAASPAAAPGASVDTSSSSASHRDGAERAPFDLACDGVRSAMQRGMHIYELWLEVTDDLLSKHQTAAGVVENINSFGMFIESSPALSELSDLDAVAKTCRHVVFLFGTVLEADLAPAALEVAESKVRPVDTSEAMRQLKESRAPERVTAGEDGGSPASKDSGAKAGPKETAETLRVRVELLTRLMNMAGELVLGRNQLMRVLEGHAAGIPGLPAILQNVDLVTTELQEGIMQTRMQPVNTVFNRYTRVVRDMARMLGKEIDLQIEGGEVELDKSIIELLADPLTHIVRNCADHALETPSERAKSGKKRSGRIFLRAYHEGGQVNVSVTDDGRGIDAKKILAKAVEKGVVNKNEAAGMSEREALNLIFAPGFSTAEKVTDVSGRGVGMDVVRTNIEKLGGTIDIETEVGKGTTVLLRLPLTLAIIPSLVVGTAGQRFAVPQVSLVELVWVRAKDVRERVENVNGAAVLRLRGRLLPLVRLADLFKLERKFKDPESAEERADRRVSILDRRVVGDGGEPSATARNRRNADRRIDWRGDLNILVLQVASNQFGLIVDELFDMEEIVVKPLSAAIKNCKSFAGATILGDGRVIMILDAAGVADLAKLQFTDLEAEEKRRREEETRRAQRAAATRRSIIFFNSGEDEYFAVPQDKVLRLERISPEDIETVGNREYIQYRGSGLPLLRLDRHLSVTPLPEEMKDLFLIIPKSGKDGDAQQAPAGIVASRIVDAMDIEVELQQARVDGPGILGSGIVNKHLTLFIDPLTLLGATGYLGDAA